MSNQIIPVFTGIINQEQIQLVNARELHQFLDVNTQFNDWINRRISDYQFIENIDFVAITQKRVIGHGRGKIDYHLTLDMAKELSMVERTEKGRQARKYFIECEKRLNGQANGYITSKLPRPIRKAIRSRDDLSFTKRNEKGHMINWYIPNRIDNWHECYGVGEMWFDEIVELARNNPKEAFCAMMYAAPLLAKDFGTGYNSGFYDQMARWALTGMLEHKGDLNLPFKPINCGIEPKEGFNHYLNQF